MNSLELLELIQNEWWDRIQGDLENGIRTLNERASAEFSEKYPTISKFGIFLAELEDKINTK